MRNRAGKIVVDLNKVLQHATASVDLPEVPTLTQVVIDDEFINENNTTYALFPYELNDPPIFTKSIYNASTPTSLHIDAYKPSLAGKVMFHDSDGVVRVLAGTNIVLRVEAIQPNVLNVENGIPILIQKKDKLVYNWTYNGETLLEEEGFFAIGQPLSETNMITDFVEVNENELILRNVTERINGTYVCLVENDIGEITSEAIELEVVNTTGTSNNYFRQNLIKNGFARDGTNEWTAVQGAIQVQPYALREAEAELKKPHTTLKQYSVNAIYPHPINLATNNIKNYDLSSLTNQNSFYFTRTPYVNADNGGRIQNIVYQDVDVTEIQDLIAGRVYGCQGVRAYFSCIIGNSLEYRPMDVLINSNPNNPKYFYQGAPRLSFENSLMTGLPRFSHEKAYVIIQEFEGNTQLSSRRYINPSEKAREVDSIILTDPHTLSRDNRRADDTLIANPSDFFYDTIRRPQYLDYYAAQWENRGNPDGPIWVAHELPNPNRIEPWLNNDTYLNEVMDSFNPKDANDEWAPNLRWGYWPPWEVSFTRRQWIDWVGSEPTRIFNTYDRLFYGHMDPEYKRLSYYTYGQYAEHKDAIITALNPRTTKIRISIVFDSWCNMDIEDSANVPLYHEWDTPQTKHHWWYGDPLRNAPAEQRTWSVGMMHNRSTKIFWGTVLDNRHIEKLRNLKITEDATYKSKINDRRTYIKNAAQQLATEGARVTLFNTADSAGSNVSAALAIFNKVGAANYTSTTSTSQQNKDYIELALKASKLLKEIKKFEFQSRRSFPSFLNEAEERLSLKYYATFVYTLSVFAGTLTKKNADIANFIKRWTPINNEAKRIEKRGEAIAEMDMLKIEWAGIKEPTSMVSALGLILEPITAGSGDISTFRPSIIRIPTKQEDIVQRPKPLDVLQTPSAKQFKVVALETL